MALLGVSNLFSYEMGRQDIRYEAVKMGVAEYLPDENGEPSFTWIQEDANKTD